MPSMQPVTLSAWSKRYQAVLKLTQWCWGGRKRRALYKAKRKIEKAKAQVRAKVEHPFRVIKRQFGYTKVRFRGLVKNTAHLVTLFALSNLWMARRHLLATAGQVRL